MPKNWDDVKSEIRSYYIDEGRSLEEVRQLMKENYQFEASPRAYKSKFVEWRFLKYTGRVLRPRHFARSAPEAEANLPPVSTDGSNNSINYLPPVTFSNWNEVQTTWPSSGTLAPFAQATAYDSLDHGFALTPGVPSAMGYQGNRSPTATVVELDTRDESGKTRLHDAVIRGDLAAVGDLISMGLSIDVYDDDDNQPIHYAASAGFAGIIQLLLKKGGDVNARGPQRKTPVHFAIQYLKAIRSLLKAHPTLSLQDNEGNTALHSVFLCASGNSPANATIVEELVESGTDVNILNASGITPLHLAIDLTRPSAKWSFDLVNYLLQKNADIFLLGNDGKLPLERLLNRGHLFWGERLKNSWCANETCELMLRKGASPNIRGKSGELLLHEVLRNAMWPPNKELLVFLCENADIGALAQNGDSPLHSGVRKWRIFFNDSSNECLQILVKRGANPNQLNHAGDTPLMVALKEKLDISATRRLVETLLENGADPMIRDSTGNLPIYVAFRLYKGNDRQSLIQLLVDTAAEPPSARFPEFDYDECEWWKEYCMLIITKLWGLSAWGLANARGLPNDIGNPLSKLLLTMAAKRILPFAQTNFQADKRSYGLQHPTTISSRDQIVLILRDCKALDIYIDRSYYYFLLELFP